MNNFVAYASIIPDVSIDKTLDYGITADCLAQARRGVRVEIPIRGHLRQGYILEIKDTPSFSPVKGIANFLSDGPLISDDLFDLALWMSRYYCAPLRDIFRLLLPSGIRNAMAPKQQLYVMRGKTREELRLLCIELRSKKPAQANVLEGMLKVKKGILLTQLLEETKCSRSSVDALAKQGILILDIIRIDRSP